MAADLTVPLDCGCAFFQIHALEHCIFPITHLNLQKCLLQMLLTFLRFCRLFLFQFLFSLIGKQIQLLIAFFLLRLFFFYHMIRSHIYPAHQEIRIHDPVIQFHYCPDNLSG